MNDKKSFHMPVSDFREQGKKMVDWIADYLENVENYPVLSQVKPGEIRAQLPASAPTEGESFDAMMKDVNKIIMPGITHWQSPDFFAFFPSNNSAPSILGEMLASGLGVQGMLWATSPAATELETHVLDWVADMLSLPAQFKSTGTGGGVIQDTASTGTLTAILAAREKKNRFMSNDKGVKNGMVAYVSSQTHSSAEKAIKIVGIGKNNLRKIEVDETFAMKPDALEKQIKTDLDNGLVPFFVCASVGTTSSNAIDPVFSIGEICKKYDLWLHIDAAMAGTAAICPEFRPLLNGIELADSFLFNPHKWMFTNFDCDCFFVADRTILINTLSILPEYLKNKATESGAVFDYRDWHVQLGRKFRALKLWFVIRHYGVEGLQFHIRKHVEMAQTFARWVDESNDFILLNQPPLNLVCFYHKNGNEFNKKLMDTINQEGKLFFSHTVLDERFVLRMCIGQTNTDWRHIETAWTIIRETAKKLSES
ncbi:MAG: amino acid decarboxylase [Bacteroidetes bacterium GWF2_42_66]|nr:MAG: amino acid decarboxylase [Bacteroidetes bacterium GWA2_42_15]OFY02688.1 MAG: amino acid decarboxylase [Bacteroidetes bacterium GWE2_42_39]OFY43887.1 MAG: amino acid decarboxylase [Bacteroidetes bacterium GWF2_42_66]HBL77256.1 aspartate aminotransferase family protein [Prolixibacteraceae bacterium]HCR90632.1 aspartate aminotransferase family protein [Prolixibacteraceae bacterium]